MSGRAKGLAAEREAVAQLRAAGLRAFRVLRARGEAADVDAVILLGPGRAIEVQIKRDESLSLRALAREVRPGRVVLYRRNREPWRAAGLGAADLSIRALAHMVRVLGGVGVLG